jgi:hypothetical protein
MLNSSDNFQILLNSKNPKKREELIHPLRVDYKAITVANERERKRVEKKYKGQLQIYAEGLKQVGIKVKDSMIITC